MDRRRAGPRHGQFGGNDVENVEGWPPTSPVFIKGKAAK
jgi:hypothetical protein